MFSPPLPLTLSIQLRSWRLQITVAVVTCSLHTDKNFLKLMKLFLKLWDVGFSSGGQWGSSGL